MYSSRYLSLSAFAALLSFGVTDPNSICYSFGVDFVDEGSYFINGQSTDPFTCVSTFHGCNGGEDLADVLLVAPDGEEYLCNSIPTTPADTPELSTCPIQKNQMTSGEWMIIISGNNDDGNPFAWERDIYLDIGPQSTATYTPTITFSDSTIVTVSSTTTSLIVSTALPTATFTVPTATAKDTKSITPQPVTTSITQTITLPHVTLTNVLVYTTKTVTASCTVPKSNKLDKPCTYSPTKIRPEALLHPTAKPKLLRKADRAVNAAYARSRIAAAKLRRDLKARREAAINERAPDAPTLTVTYSIPVSQTVTNTVTTTIPFLATSTTTTTLPPVTIRAGVFTSTITLPTPTKTRLGFTYTDATMTQTIRVTFTRTTTVTPSASATACKALGGHIGDGRL